jgi:imidazolonepropionase-like amidohydrolase
MQRTTSWRRRGAGLAALTLAATAVYGASRPMPDFAADPYPSTYRPLPAVDTLIVGVTVLDGAGARIDDTDVLMKAGRIVSMGHDLPRDGVTVVEGRGRWLTPGIVDVHSHNGTFVLPLTSLDQKSSDVSETSDPNAAGTWVEHAVNAQDPAFAVALSSGVTTLQIVPGSVPLFAGRSVVVKPVPATDVYAMKFPGARQGLKMSCGENAKSHFGEKDDAPNSRQGEIEIIRDAFLRAKHYREQWREYSRGKAKQPPERDLELDTLVGVLEGQIPVHMHCYRSSDMAVMLELADEVGFHIAAFHHAADAYKMPAQLRSHDTCIAVWSDWWGFKMELLDGIRENAAMVDAAGGCVMMHSDSPIVGQRLAIEAAKAAAAGRRAGIAIAPEHLIRWVTSAPARVLGLGDRIGKVAPGFNADVVIWSGDPFSIYTHADQVFVDGALAYDRSKPAPPPDFALGRPGMEAAP